MEVLDLRDGRVDREELVSYLAHFETEDKYTEQNWRDRLRFYWDDNPCHDPAAPHGWALTANGKIRGFLGGIQGRFHGLGEAGPVSLPALSATSWRVDSEVRNQSMLLFMRYMQAKKDFLLVDTTPTPSVEKILTAFKFEGPYLSHNYVIPLKPFHLFAPAAWAKVQGEKLQAAQLRELTVDFPCAPGYMQRQITRALLDWYAFKGIQERHLYGYVEHGDLKAYVLLLREVFRGIPILRAVDFQAKSGFEDRIPGLVSRIAADGARRLRARLLIFTTFPANPLQNSFTFTAWNKKKFDQHHYLFATPTVRQGLKWAPKMFDGDYGC